MIMTLATTKKELAALDRERHINMMVANIEERGSTCIVPSSRDPKQTYEVEIYRDRCQCPGGKGACMHKEAVRRYYAQQAAERAAYVVEFMIYNY